MSQEPEGIANSRLDSGLRFDGWKEIACFLNRDVRTVQRWESKENLPVHRHLHGARASVFAYQHELEVWWDNYSSVYDNGTIEGSSFGRKALLGLGGIAAGLAVLLFGFWVLDFIPPRLPSVVVDFQERDWVLVAEFENTTGEPLLTGALSFALEQELSSSPYLNVVPRARVEDALRLMKKPVASRLDLALAKEISLRDGNIQAIIWGRVGKASPAYSVDLRIQSPKGEETLTSRTVAAKDHGQVLSSVRQLAGWAREVLGETASKVQENGNESLRKVTTASLRALQLFTEADTLERYDLRQNDSPNRTKVIELLRSAIAEDPEFAMAHSRLARALYFQRPGEVCDECIELSARAVQLSEGLSRRERYLISGTFYDLNGEFTEARRAWEELTQLYPDDFWGNIYLNGLYRRMGLFDEAYQLSFRAAELRPHDFFANHQAARACIYKGDHPQAEYFINRALALITPEIIGIRTGHVVWLKSYPALKHWREGDLHGMLQVFTDLSLERESGPEELLDPLTLRLGAIYFALGMNRRAAVYFDQVSHDFGKWVMTSFETSPQNGPVRPPILLDRQLNFYNAFVLCRSGNLQQAEEVVTALDEKYSPRYFPEFLHILRGEFCRALGDNSTAVSELEIGLRRQFSGLPGLFFLAAESLAYLYELQGNLDRAAGVLEGASQRKNTILEIEQIPFWLKNQWLLSRIYRKMGRENDARRLEADVLQLLQFADKDHPILREMAEG